MSKKIILGLLLIFISSLVKADGIQSLDLIKERIEQYILNELPAENNQKAQITAQRIDPRLHLKACDNEKLEVFNPYKTSILHTTTIGIKCQETDNHWILYVSVKVNLQQRVVVTKNSLAKEAVIQAEDVYVTEINVSNLKHGYFSDTKEVIGKTAKFNIQQGNTLSPDHLRLPFLVLKGEQITIQATDDLINVSMSGIALENGVLGDTIRVKNISSKKVIQAQINNRKLVKVTL